MAIELTGDNSTLLQSQIASLLVQPLEQQSSFLGAGPTIIDSASPVRVPRIASGVNAGWVAEGAQIPDGGVAFDEVEMLPSSLKSLKVLVRLSNELIRQSVIGIENVIRTRLITDVANALDAALYDGTGSSNTVKGIFRTSGIETGVLDLTDADSLIDGLATAQGNHVNPSHWVMTPQSFATLRKLKVGSDDNRYIFNPVDGVQAGTRFQLLGLPVIVTDNIPNVGGKARVGLVDFGKIAVARDVDAVVKILDQTWGDYDSIGVRVVTRYDVAPLQDKAVTLLTEAG